MEVAVVVAGADLLGDGRGWLFLNHAASSGLDLRVRFDQGTGSGFETGGIQCSDATEGVEFCFRCSFGENGLELGQGILLRERGAEECFPLRGGSHNACAAEGKGLHFAQGCDVISSSEY